MKVFWAWQSDTPGKIGRHLIRSALEEAIHKVKSSPEIDEPTDRDAREALHLDQDRKGITGSPDLARIIFEKIANARVVVADVTAVGAVVDENGNVLKRLINSNVAIELGFALHAVGDLNILMVQNTHYGNRKDLPFDLQHKAGPVEFQLAPDAPKEQIDRERKKLVGVFASAFAEYLANEIDQIKGQSAEPTVETATTFSPAVFFSKGEALARTSSSQSGEIALQMIADRCFYLRLIPTVKLSPQISLADLRGVANRDLVPLSSDLSNLSFDVNPYGVIAFEHSKAKNSIETLTQAFRSGELWGLSSELINTKRYEFPFIPTLLFEETYYHCLRKYLWFSQTILEQKAPFTVAAGGVGLRGAQLAVRNMFDKFVGPVHQDAFEVRGSLANTDDATINAYLLKFFEELYDLTGNRRPTNSYSFPPGPPR